MRKLKICVALLACVLSSGVAAYDADIHYSTTFALALALGMDWADARIVASADQGVDENVETRPTEHIAVGPTLGDQQQQLELHKLVLGLSLQDYYFHCFSRQRDAPGKRHKTVTDHLAALEAIAAKAVGQYLVDRKANIEHPGAFARERASKVRALIAIGVYLHCQQDSWSHSGFGGYPMGHVLADLRGENPDHPSNRSDILALALMETRDKLITFMRSWDQQPVFISKQDIEQLIKGMIEERTRRWGTDERIACNDALARYWAERFVAAHFASYATTLPADAHTTVEITTKIERVTRREDGSRVSDLIGGADLVSFGCELLLKDAFTEIPFTSRIEGSRIYWWATPVSVRLIARAEPLYPVYAVKLDRFDQVNDSDGSYAFLINPPSARTPPLYDPSMQRWSGEVFALEVIAGILFVGFTYASGVRIASKAGYAWWLGLITTLFLPVSLPVVWWFAFRARWPAVRTRQAGEPGGS